MMINVEIFEDSDSGSVSLRELGRVEVFFLSYYYYYYYYYIIIIIIITIIIIIIILLLLLLFFPSWQLLQLA